MRNMSFIDLPLHTGHVPRWLFARMIRLAKAIFKIILEEYGSQEVIKRFGDPLWFQALSCVLGFDWDSSGTTTVTTAALRRAFEELDEGVALCGGKGKAALETPKRLEEVCKRFDLDTEKYKKLSRLTAKVDSCLLQDGYSLYHHCVIVDEEGHWAIIQQGLHDETRTARRYHWTYITKNFVIEPHSGLFSFALSSDVLNLTSRKSKEAHGVILDLVKEKPNKIKSLVSQVQRPHDHTLDMWLYGREEERRRITRGYKLLSLELNWKALERAYELQPRSMEELLLIKGLGPGTVRALALIAELIYGCELDWSDPLRYAYAFGGKDGVPYPVNRKRMDKVISILEQAINEARIGNKERLEAIRRLKGMVRKIEKTYYLVRV